MDTLRADRIGAYGYSAARTPALDELAAASLRFERAYAHSSMTLPSVASLLTGQLPAQHGVYANLGQLPDGVPTLATRLRGEGFATAAFVGTYALRPQRGLSRGFDRYTEEYFSAERVRAHPENPGELLTDQAIVWLRARDPVQRWFVWIHYQEPHGPYTPPHFVEPSGRGEEDLVLPLSRSQSGRGAIPRYQWLGHGRLAEYRARYDGEIAEVDHQLGRLLGALQAEGRLEESALIFTADHGEAFGEEGVFCAHGEGLGEALLRVPLLLRVPGEPGGVRRDVVRLVDVLPTALELLGLEAEPLPGESLLREVGDRQVVAQIDAFSGRWRSVREGDFKLVQEVSGRSVLSDLSAGEETPLGQEDERHRRLEDRLRRLAPWPPRIRERPQLSADERRALRALGYAD